MFDEVVVVAFGLVRRCHMANSLMAFQFHMNKGKIRFNIYLPASHVHISCTKVPMASNQALMHS